MQALIKNQTVISFPYSFSDLKHDNPQVSYPQTPTEEALESYGLVTVVSTGAQYDQATQVATQVGCEYNEALHRWQTSWVVRELNTQELELKVATIQSDIITKTQTRLDDFARIKNYDGILSATTYATSTVPQFAAEGQQAVVSRDQTWAALYTILAEVQAGTRPMPASYEEIESDLPELSWVIV